MIKQETSENYENSSHSVITQYYWRDPQWLNIFTVLKVTSVSVTYDVVFTANVPWSEWSNQILYVGLSCVTFSKLRKPSIQLYGTVPREKPQLVLCFKHFTKQQVC